MLKLLINNLKQRRREFKERDLLLAEQMKRLFERKENGPRICSESKVTRKS